MRRITKEDYQKDEKRYEIRSGKTDEAPDCPYGNKYEWLGYDLMTSEYVRFSKGLFTQLIEKHKTI